MTPRQQQFFEALPTSWKKPLEAVCRRPEIDALVQFLQERESKGATIYPAKQNVFAALKATPFDKVSVVIVGQDPYHGPGQAHGLSKLRIFSMRRVGLSRFIGPPRWRIKFW